MATTLHEHYPDRYPMPGQLPLLGLSADAAQALLAAVRLHAWAADPDRCPRLVYGRRAGEFSSAEWTRLLGSGWAGSYSAGGRLHDVNQDALLRLGFTTGSGWNHAVTARGRAYAADLLAAGAGAGPAARGPLGALMAGAR